MAKRGRRARAGRGAFTLIELLVVVAIIAVLISILLPALSHARQQGRTVACQAQLHNLGLAVLLYAQDNRGWFPEYGFMHGGGDARREHSWITRMAAEYGHDEDILRCPADRSALRRTVLPGEDEADVGPVRHTSYATNFYVAAGGIDNPLYGRDGHAYNRLDWIRHPASTIHFVELAEEGDYALADHVHPENWDAYFPEERAVAAEQVMLDRHQRAANYGLIDGHVERLKYEQTYQIHEDFYGAAGEILWLQNKYDPTVAR